MNNRARHQTINIRLSIQILCTSLESILLLLLHGVSNDYFTIIIAILLVRSWKKYRSTYCIKVIVIVVGVSSVFVFIFSRVSRVHVYKNTSRNRRSLDAYSHQINKIYALFVGPCVKYARYVCIISAEEQTRSLGSEGNR